MAVSNEQVSNLIQRFTVMSYEDYHRNCRNSSREDAIDAIGKLECALGDLSDDQGNGFQNSLKDLAELREYLVRDWEE